MRRTRKNVSLAVMTISAVTYYLVTDPDLGLVTDLSFGVELLILLNIFMLSGMSITLMEMAPRLFFDGGENDGDEREIVRKAKEDPIGSGILFLGNSIRIVGYAIVIAASIYSVAVH